MKGFEKRFRKEPEKCQWRKVTSHIWSVSSLKRGNITTGNVCWLLCAFPGEYKPASTYEDLTLEAPPEISYSTQGKSISAKMIILKYTRVSEMKTLNIF
jgi:hypothetical protein